MKNKDKLSKASSAGRVAGKGLSTKWSSYYTAGGRKEKKTSSESQAREVQELKAQVARIPEIVQEQVQQQLGTTLTVMVPTLIHGLTTWIAGGNHGHPHSRCWPPAPDSQLHGQQLAQRAGGAIGVSGGGGIGVSGGGAIGVSGGGGIGVSDTGIGA